MILAAYYANSDAAGTVSLTWKKNSLWPNAKKVISLPAPDVKPLS